MRLNLFHFLLMLFFNNVVYSQSSYNSVKKNIPASATINVSSITVDYKPVLQNMEAPVPGGSSYREFLLQQKQLIQPKQQKQKRSSTVPLGEAVNPLVIAGFEANEYDGSVPTDNDVAISNNNMLVSVANSTIYIFDMNIDSLVKSISLEAFADTLGLPANMYDPKICYDPKQDKFIIIFLCGSSSANTNIVVAFSETNNPLDNWFLYALPGNPVQDTVWTDYPAIAITDDELFITGNLLRDRDPSDTRPDAWKFLFEETIIWQINKNSGYAGNTLQTKVYNEIKFNNQPIRNLCPIQGGSTTTGPNIYLLSNRNFDIANDTFFILEVTGEIDNQATVLTTDFRIASTPYGLAPDGIQTSNQFLQTNDSRVLGGYIENNTIHFVMNSINPDSVRSALYHGKVSNVSGAKNFSGNIIGVNELDFAYPNISYTGKFAGDDEAIITFNHTSVDSAAGVSAIFYNGNTNQYSERVTLKSGDSFVNVFGNTAFERWGDYTGTQRKYNEPGKVWVSGFFGTRRALPGSPTQRRINWSWVSALESADTSTTSSITQLKKTFNIKSYPNPAINKVAIEFELEAAADIQAALYSAEGKLLKVLYQDFTKKGKNIFSFSTEALAQGTYFITVSSNNQPLAHQKIIKQ